MVWNIPLDSLGKLSWLCPFPRSCQPPAHWLLRVVRGDDVGEITLMLCQRCPALAKTLIISTFVATEYSAVRAAKGKISFLSARPNTWFYIVEWLMLEETDGGHLIWPLALAGSPWACYSGLCPDGFWIPPGKETPQPLCAAYSSPLPPSL